MKTVKNPTNDNIVPNPTLNFELQYLKKQLSKFEKNTNNDK